MLPSVSDQSLLPLEKVEKLCLYPGKKKSKAIAYTDINC